MVTKVLMIGLDKAFVDSLVASNKNYEVYILEEKEIYDSCSVEYTRKPIKEVRFSQYQQSSEIIDIICKWHKEVSFNVIVPGAEYAVKGTYKAMDILGFANPGQIAVEACTNKYKLRQICCAIGVPQPNFLKVNSTDQIEKFFNKKPIVIKPINRQASVGVVKVEKKEDIAGAWEECLNVSEGSRVVKRSLKWEYMVEDFIRGYEVSIESIVLKGESLFNNITYKDTIGGNYFAETGHIVPAEICDKDKQALLNSNEQMLKGLEAKSGLFHSEWKITEEGPKLIECAVRAPGDKIPELIKEVYKFNLFEAFLKVLMGEQPEINYTHNSYAGIRYFRPNPGRLVKITGVHILKDSPNVIKYLLNASSGQIIRPIKCSWDRIGFYMVRGNSLEELKRIMLEIENEIKFIIE
ncbi:hypothetical protein SH1V18_34970 [Vallitalea longa]|uniref:ATP-grasp domain-containing protein n=1 Tax=Vallitalea longa TaxID=2936439 RepID=A0A9W5YCM0_9FIRM|nr:ATP-grasp domain-containing protein [Vallitalea longa]GKX31017.1 hypothetical protein SH1V18_34970 [Vallitalea longa]